MLFVTPPRKLEADWTTKASGIYHMTAAGREPNYNTVIERASAILENMSFAMVHYAHKPKYTKI